MKILRDLNIWANSNKLLLKLGGLDRCIHSRMLQLETLEGRITPAIYRVVNNFDAGTGSLRDAITLANANTGPDIIDFNITGGVTGAVQTITLTTALPVITDQVTINGTTQLGYSANTLSVGAGNNAAIKIQLNGANLIKGGEVGLYLNSAGSSVTGLSFVNFPFAIYANNNNITIKGNYFGVNADGTAQSKGLSGVGVDIATFNAAIVGGNTAADQNIFGNLTTGILQIAGSGSSFTGNRIGLGTTNTSFMPNTTGIQINNNANVDALNHSISANLIGKNTTGIKLIGFQGGTGTVRGTQILGNLIGTNSPGSTNNLGNSGDAISIDDGVINTMIGNPSGPNTIAYSNQNGVFINGAASVGNTIQYNNIRNNLGRGILLLNGANNNISSPVLTQQIPNGAGGFTYSGFVNGVANTQYTVDFYSSLISDSRSQGANYLGSTTVTTDANGNIGFTGFDPGQNQTALYANSVVTATATNVGFGTSVFSAGPPAQISVVSGSSQTAMVGTAFTNPLTAKVVDSRGDPVPNIQVQFAAPNSNPPTNPATGLFAGSLQTIIAITNTVGEAASTTLTANNAPGNFTVLAQVVNNAGIAPVSFALTNTPPAPTITSFTPTSGQAGTSVVISGSGFVGSVQVNFNGATATNVVVNSATQITARVPTGATTGLISVTTPGGTVTTPTNFTVTPSAAVTYSVTNTLDSGLGSLRQAINDANATAGNDIINFNFATGSGPYKITLNSSLPNILAASSSGSLTITGLGAPSLTIGANKNNFSIFSIDSGGNLSISGVTVSGAQTTGKGGAFNNAGTLTVSNSTISGNTADTGGGGIFNNGTLTVTNSTLSGNSAVYGGGISNNSTLTVFNCTLSSNIASSIGGGILNSGNGILTLTSSTLSDNSAAALFNSVSGGGGIFNSSAGFIGVGIVNITNTIIANSTSGGDYSGIGNIGTNLNNLVEDGSITGTIQADPLLGPLQNNGGPTFTMALGAGSPAIGAGNAPISNTTPINSLDQRGFARSYSAPSIGAYEYNGIAPAPASDFIYTSSGSGVTITGYIGAGGAVNIPKTINGEPVFAIGDMAFKLNIHLTSVTIPSSVNFIGAQAFYGCTSLTSINSLFLREIGAQAFSGCTSLTSITLFGARIQAQAFNGCTNLASLYFNDAAPFPISSMFAGVTGTIYYKQGTIGWSNPFSYERIPAVAVSTPTVTLNTGSLTNNATTVTITGTNFVPTPSMNAVTFSSGTGHVTSATSTQLIVTFDIAPALGGLTAIVTSFGGTSTSVQVANILASTTTALTSSTNPSVFGQSVTFT
ncbi:MAG: choice-of-anchor Q domain-containing protein, partial [Planctomycetota bacterium]